MVYKNINWLSVNKDQMAKNMKFTKKEWFKNKKYNTKTNKRISKSNSSQRKMSLNEEWYIIPRELEAEEIINRNHIKHGPHLKLNPTLKDIKKCAYDWNNIKKDIRNFYFKCLTCEIRTSKPKKLCSQAYRIGLSQRKYQVDTTYLANYISNDSNI